jgi:23S rRNA pseudouridine955/2504/2580 synthase
MPGVRTIEIAAADDGMRLDRWFRREFPDLPHGRLQKLLRKGEVRLDGGRVKGDTRIAAGQRLRLPPMDAAPAPRPRGKEVSLSPKEAKALRARVLHRDAEVIVFDKPAGLAVQGGSKTGKHLDGMLDALKFDAPEPPRLVHRLDKDTSGVLLLARSAQAARTLTAAFRARETEKTYWAVTVGVPEPREGRIAAPLAKLPGRGGEQMAVAEDGQPAETEYRVLDHAAKTAALVELMPRTGRTHQLRVHMAYLGTPILGDGKYGGAEAFLEGDGISPQLHLHARRLVLPRKGRTPLDVTAPLPEHMRRTFDFLGFDADGG